MTSVDITPYRQLQRSRASEHWWFLIVFAATFVLPIAFITIARAYFSQIGWVEPLIFGIVIFVGGSWLVETLLTRYRSGLEVSVADFEQSLRSSIESVLASHKEQYLFRKKRASPSFAGALSEYEVLISVATMVNPYLFQPMGFVQEHRNYAYSRSIGHVTDFPSEPPPINRPKPIPNPIEQTFGGQGRRIDWASINAKRAAVGQSGEELVAAIERNWLTQFGKPELATRVRILPDEGNDSAGYDILSFFLDGSPKYIEVKATSQPNETGFYISSAELSFLRANSGAAFIYRITFLADEATLRVLTVDELLQFPLEASSYRVRLQKK